ncbi:hypothetical protein V8C26DRAFT_222479 [Trichoderma gracile]
MSLPAGQSWGATSRRPWRKSKSGSSDLPLCAVQRLLSGTAVWKGRNAPAFTDDAGSCLLVRASYLPCRWPLPVSWPCTGSTLNFIHRLQSIILRLILCLVHGSSSSHLAIWCLTIFVSSLVHVFRLIQSLSLCVRPSQQRLCKQQDGRAVPHKQTCSCIIIMTGVQPARSSQECRQTVSSPWLALPCVSPCLALPRRASPRLAFGPRPCWKRNPSEAASCFSTLEGRPIALRLTRWHAKQKPRIPCRFASFLMAHRQTNVIRLTTTGTTAATENLLSAAPALLWLLVAAWGLQFTLRRSQNRRRGPPPWEAG